MNDNYPPGVTGMEDEIIGQEIHTESRYCDFCDDDFTTEVDYWAYVKRWVCPKCGIETEEEIDK